MINLIILAESNSVAPPSAMSWANFGLAGLVIGAMFWVLVNLHNSHKEERKDWKNDAGKREERAAAVIDKLSESIKELGNKS